MATIISVAKFNTNNAWGFGGGIGKVTTYSNGYEMRKGRAFYRHLPSERFARYYDSLGRLITKSQFEKGIMEDDYEEE